MDYKKIPIPENRDQDRKELRLKLIESRLQSIENSIKKLNFSIRANTVSLFVIAIIISLIGFKL